MHDIKRIVKHKIFGIGTIKAQNETKIWVKFENKDHLLVFDYPKEDYTNFFVFIDQTEIKQKELVDVLVKYIIYNDKTVFPKEELFNFCSKRFSNIVSEDL